MIIGGLIIALVAYLWTYHRYRQVNVSYPGGCYEVLCFRVERLSGDVEQLNKTTHEYERVGKCPYSVTLDCYTDILGRQLTTPESKLTKVCD